MAVYMQVLPISNISHSQSMGGNLAKISQDDSSFQSFLQLKDVQEACDKSKSVPEMTQKLQGIMFQYFIKSILPEETVKSLGGGFNGDFWQEILAENISDVIVKQQRITLDLPEISK
ncbi:hypothetical protein Q7M04_03420 [Candidatus Liberibacter asiaticus]|nr:hypothetical protein [Candidatus Liberibacter asiaticus]MCU7488705.1 hypothetical protein [Candidatus Liberibacter asiaticus]